MKCKKVMASAIVVFWLGALMIGPSFAFEDSAGVPLKATPERFDAGKVAEGKTVEATASIQNTGSAPVEITNVRTS